MDAGNLGSSDCPWSSQGWDRETWQGLALGEPRGFGEGDLFSQSSKGRNFVGGRENRQGSAFGGNNLGMQLPTVPSLLPGSLSRLNQNVVQEQGI